MNLTNKRVLVVGLGPVGAATAALLLQQDLSVVAIEKDADAFDEDVHVLYFAPSRIYAGFRSLPVLSLALDLTASWRRKRIGITGCQEEHPLFFRLMTAFLQSIYVEASTL